jgi:RsiW-degrading membrane proteinase PrsW (M82 family)
MDPLLGVLLAALFGLPPMMVFAVVLTWLDIYEKEPPLLFITVFLWGFSVAAGSALVINTLFGLSIFLITGNQGISDVTTTVFIGPVVEESVKALALLLLFLFFRKHFNTPLDGIVYGSLVGFGFAAAENILYIFGGFMRSGLSGMLTVALVRTVLIPFLHATLTALTGIGLSVARLTRGRKRYIAPLAGFAAAVGLHSLHNFLAITRIPILQLAGFFIDWMGVAGVVILIGHLIRGEARIMRRYLLEEVSLGNIRLEEYMDTVSIYRRNATCWTCLDSNKRSNLKELYNLSGELAFLKYEQEKTGATKTSEIAVLRSRLKDVSERLPE